MDRNKDFTNSCEEKDWTLMTEFTANATFFTSCYRRPKYDHVDCYAERNDKKYNVELKSRDMSHTEHNAYFLECDKYAELRRNSDNGYTPLYINFFSDGYTAIWCVDPNKGGINVGKPRKIISTDPSTGLQEKTAKYLLPISKAVIYNSTYTKVQ